MPSLDKDATISRRGPGLGRGRGLSLAGEVRLPANLEDKAAELVPEQAGLLAQGVA